MINLGSVAHSFLLALLLAAADAKRAAPAAAAPAPSPLDAARRALADADGWTVAAGCCLAPLLALALGRCARAPAPRAAAPGGGAQLPARPRIVVVNRARVDFDGEIVFAPRRAPTCLSTNNWFR